MSRRSRSGRRLAIGMGGALAVILGLVAGAAIYVTRADLASHAAGFASSALQREVSIDSLRLGWQGGVTVELRGLSIANASWSETPRMIVVGAASALVDAGSLLGGALRYERLELRGLRATLERDPQGVGNWEFGASEGAAAGGGAVVPKDRTGFPTLIDATLRDSRVTYRTSSGAILKIDLDEVRIASPDDDQPVAISAAGAYNDVAARVSGTGQPFDAMRDASRPYGLAFTIETDTTTATYDGTLMRPLDFDGADGRLAIDASDTGDLDRMFGAGIGVSFPLQVAGHMTRTGDDWRLDGAEGAVAGSTFTGVLRLREGGRGAADDIAADLDFTRFDVAPFLGESAAPEGGYLAMPLTAGEAPGVNVEADLRADSVVHGETQLADIVLTGRTVGRAITIDRLAFALAGGRATASGTSQPAESGARVVLEAALDAIDTGALASSIGAAPGDVSGSFDGRATLDMTGLTLGDALGNSRGHAVLAMNEGRIARAILEMAATDLRSLFRSQDGTARIRCLLGIMSVENGVGRVPLLKLRTTEATLDGRGAVNLVEERIDMTFMTAPDSTGFFALDVPFRVHGSLESPSIDPQLGGGTRPGEFPTAESGGATLPPALRQLAEGNACNG